MAGELFADVAVLNSAVHVLLTYRVPADMAAHLAPGSGVVVPLRRRSTAGVVVRVRGEAPAGLAAVKSIERLIDQLPVLSPQRLELAAWIAREYASPLGRACGMMVPPGYTPKSAYVYQLAPAGSTRGPAGPVTTDPTAQAVLDGLRARGALLEPRLRAEMSRRKIAGWRRALTQLIGSGAVVRTSTLELPRAAHTRSTLAQLAIGAATLELVLANLAARGEAGARRSAALQHLGGRNGLAWADWLLAETGATRADLVWMAERGYIVLGDAERWRDPLADVDYVPREAPALTSDQAAAWNAVRSEMLSALAASGPVAEAPRFLLRGVTGSGKTEVYMRAVDLALQHGRSSIVLVPEISLTPQTARRFLERFPGKVALIHSRLKPSERFDTWRRIRAGDLPIVVGARSALFAPLPNPGLIVLDEEHDGSYKQDRAPHYDARRAAEKLAALYGATLVFGSATPSLEAWHEANAAGDVAAAGAAPLRALELPNRVRAHAERVQDQAARLGLQPVAKAETASVVYQPLPDVHVIDMRAELRGGNTSMFSGALQSALAETLRRGEQAILFLNRRGMSSCVVCRDCGLALKCPNDDIPLTVHVPAEGGAVRDAHVLKCHQCGHSEPMPGRCPSCGGPRIRHIGIGTQRIEEAVKTQFPAARVVRWDKDTASARGAADYLLQRFTSRQADVLVGTQMIAKGLDLPMVTLVGVVLADVGLFLPDFRASERVFDLVEQVAGRAGRSLLAGRVIVQTYNPDHPAITYSAHHDVRGFARYELAQRKRLALPPYVRLVRFECADLDADKARAACQHVALQLRRRVADPAGLIGPSACYFARRNREWRWHVIARTGDPSALLRGLDVPRNVSIDVDPLSML